MVKHPSAFSKLQRMGITREYFVDVYSTIWHHITKAKRDHDAVPSATALRLRFPDLDLPPVASSDMSMLVAQLKQRRKFMEFVTALNDAAGETTSFEEVDTAVQKLQAKLNALAYSNGGGAHLIDLFSEQIRERMVKELQDRRSGRIQGIPTGLPRLDAMTGGLLKQQMVLIMGRTGMGKTWINLLFVAMAVKAGYKVVLYPLEMSLTETAFRLYTIFSQILLGQDRVLKNYDLITGKVTTRKMVRLLSLLENRFKGSLLVADVGSLSDRYTNERIEAEVEAHRPDMFWVDYLTLLKGPPGRSGDDKDWQAVAALAEGIKNTAMRRNCVGGASAQVNREAIKGRIFLPGPEHISFGDGIAHPCDKIVSINRKDGHLYYRLCKSRGGPEFGATKVRWQVDEGLIEEIGATGEED